MFCSKCGSSVPEGSKFCPKCGAAANPAPGAAPASSSGSAPQPAPQPSPSVGSSPKLSSKTVGIGIGVIAVIVVAVIAFMVFGGGACVNSPEGLVGTYIKATFECDAETIWKNLSPEMRDAALDQSDMDEDELIDQLNDSLEYSIDDYLDDTYGDGWTYSYEITDEHQMSESDLEDMEEWYDDTYDFKIDLQDGYSYDVDVTVKSKDGEDEETNSMYVSVIKSGGKWYLTTPY